MAMFDWFRRFAGFFTRVYRAHLRETDIEHLWPACRAQAPDLETARAAFAAHALNDTAWTDEFTRDEILGMISGLR